MLFTHKEQFQVFTVTLVDPLSVKHALRSTEQVTSSQQPYMLHLLRGMRSSTVHLKCCHSALMVSGILLPMRRMTERSLAIRQPP